MYNSGKWIHPVDSPQIGVRKTYVEKSMPRLDKFATCKCEHLHFRRHPICSAVCDDTHSEVCHPTQRSNLSKQAQHGDTLCTCIPHQAKLSSQHHWSATKSASVGIRRSKIVNQLGGCRMLVVSFTLIVMPGMVQAKVAHFVTPLKRMYDKYDWRVTSQKPHKKHNSPNKHHHHGGGAAKPSDGVDLMPPEGRASLRIFFQSRCCRILIDSLN